MKFNVAALAVLAATLSTAPIIASADATTTGSSSTLASPMMMSYHGKHHRHHRHRSHPRNSTASSRT